MMRIITAAILIWLFSILRREVASSFRTLRAHPRAVRLLTGGAILGPVLGVWLSLIAVQNTSVGVASTLSSLMPIFLIPISYVVFGERVNGRAILGTLIAVGGSVLLFL